MKRLIAVTLTYIILFTCFSAFFVLMQSAFSVAPTRNLDYMCIHLVYMYMYVHTCTVQECTGTCGRALQRAILGGLDHIEVV